MRSRIEPMKKIARSLRQHRELILNYFRNQKLISSGVVEGLNNKAKVTMRKSCGFRTYRVLELALYHSPASTHDFFCGVFFRKPNLQRDPWAHFNRTCPIVRLKCRTFRLPMETLSKCSGVAARVGDHRAPRYTISAWSGATF